MTAKERRDMAHLRNENAELMEQLSRHMRVYSDNLFELVRYKVALQDLQDALSESVKELSQ